MRIESYVCIALRSVTSKRRREDSELRLRRRSSSVVWSEERAEEVASILAVVPGLGGEVEEVEEPSTIVLHCVTIRSIPSIKFLLTFAISPLA